MSQKRILFALFFFALSFFALTPALADVYSVSFSFDSGTDKLEFGPNNTQAVSIDSTKSLPMDTGYQIYPNGTYEAVFVSVKGNEIDRKRFDVVSGNFLVEFPYYSIAKTLNIYKVGSSKLLLSYDLSEFTKCFMNGVCEYEKGENLQTCVSDCASDTVQFSDETKKLLKQNNDIIKDPKTREVLLRGIAPIAGTPTSGEGGTSGSADTMVLVVGIVVLLLIIGGVVVVIRLRKRNKQYGL